MHYHPGAFMKNKWTCCQQRVRTILGCQPTYHLLTRSSSRYAQMRRKDTLTGSTNSQRWARGGSRGSRFANTTASTDIEDTLCSEVRSSGHMLSNSFVELSLHPHHSESVFTLSSPPATNSGSRRSSKNSTEHSVGVGTMVLTRVSVSDAAGETEEEEDGISSRSLSQSSTPKHSKSERVRMGSRSQIGPAWHIGSSPISRSRSERGHSYEMEHRTLPSSFKSRPPLTGLNNSWDHSLKSEERGDPVGEEDAQPVPPPRLKKGLYSPTISSLVGSSLRSPLPVQRSPPSPSSRTLPNTPAKLNHSRTFVMDPRVKNLQSEGYGFSQSMGALAKPLIEPKLSMSNPNVIHV